MPVTPRTASASSRSPTEAEALTWWPDWRHWGSLKQRLWTLDTDRVRPMATVVLDPAIPDERHALTSLQASVAVAFDVEKWTNSTSPSSAAIRP